MVQCFTFLSGKKQTKLHSSQIPNKNYSESIKKLKNELNELQLDYCTIKDIDEVLLK